MSEHMRSHKLEVPLECNYPGCKTVRQYLKYEIQKTHSNKKISDHNVRAFNEDACDQISHDHSEKANKHINFCTVQSMIECNK